MKIAPLEQDKPAEQQTERKVTIVGSPESQWKVSVEEQRIKQVLLNVSVTEIIISTVMYIHKVIIKMLYVNDKSRMKSS